MDFGLTLFEDATSIYTNEDMGAGPSLNPVYWGMDEASSNDDFDDLEAAGYTLL